MMEEAWRCTLHLSSYTHSPTITVEQCRVATDLQPTLLKAMSDEYSINGHTSKIPTKGFRVEFSQETITKK